jgi:excinuclease UvrABC nuclease subunit
MREPLLASPLDLDSIPDRPAVFLLWAGAGKPYLARTALLRRRLRRLLSERDRTSRVLNLRGVIERIEYWLTGSQLDSSLIHLQLAQQHFPDEWQRIVRLRPPAFVRLTLDNQFPRTMVTTRLGRGLFYGPFPSRGAAENFNNEMLDLFQIRRCEENLQPSPQHPGCIYGEMNRCLRPCQQAVSVEEYRGEAARVEQFLNSGGASLRDPAEQARDRASASMQFEDAERLHQRVARIAEVQSSGGELPRTLDQLAGVAVVPSSQPDAVELWFLIGGCWQPPRHLWLTEIAGAGQSMDRRLRDIVAALDPQGGPIPEHLAILTRWHTSSWRDGEWIEIDWPSKIPYRKLVNAIARVAHPAAPTTAKLD